MNHDEGEALPKGQNSAYRQSESESRYDRRSAGQSVLVSSPI
jgi:hypothetical protein